MSIVQIPAGDLVRVLPFRSTDDVRYYLNGIYVEPYEGCLTPPQEVVMKIFIWIVAVVMALLFTLQAAMGWSAWAAPVWPILWAMAIGRQH